MKCLVSVVIPCYNHGSYLPEAIASVEENAGATAYELIIVDDGSTDPSTIHLIEELQGQRYHIIRQANQGLAAARNNGIVAAQGKYIIPLDSDNKLHRNYLSTAIDLLEADDTLDIVYGNPMVFGADDGQRTSGLKWVGKPKLTRMLDCNYIDACAVLRKSVWAELGGYDSRMPAMGHEDWEIWIHALVKGKKFHYLDALCYYYRIVENSMLVTNGEYKHIINQEYIFKKHAKQLITILLSDISRLEKIERNLDQYRTRSIVKLLLGYKI